MSDEIFESNEFLSYEEILKRKDEELVDEHIQTLIKKKVYGVD